jgi:hypothetical protein
MEELVGSDQVELRMYCDNDGINKNDMIQRVALA